MVYMGSSPHTDDLPFTFNSILLRNKNYVLYWVIMSPCLFERFIAMIDSVPAKGVLRAVELEGQTLQNDLAFKRTMPLGDARSILAFYNFLKSTVAGIGVEHSILPIQHIVFYKKTIERLIEAGQLPYEAKEQFHETFFSGFVKAFVS
jgi:hypothetical protein